MKFSYLPIALFGMVLSACGPEATSKMASTETQFDFERACKETVLNMRFEPTILMVKGCRTCL